MVQQDVRKRRVFYIPGYDPIPPRRYRELFRKEGALQAQISGYQLQMGASAAVQGFGWRANAQISGHSCDSDFQVLVWSDIVRDSMANSVLATYGQLLITAWAYIGTGALWRLMRLRKGPVIAALYPVVALLGQLALALMLAAGVAWALVAGAQALALPHWAGMALGALAASGALMATLGWFRANDNRFCAYYLMHDYAFSARYYGAVPPQLEARMAAFTQTVAAALDSDADEVLVVGHSSGAHLAVSVLADLLRHQPVAPGRLGFLSLGQVVPMVSFLPRAGRLRADLAYLAAHEGLTWVDVSAPGDGCSFALCDPVAVSGVAPAGQRWPLVISAAFTQTLSPARWQALRWRFFRLHFQYLCAFDRPKDYDYFQITTGPISLAQRFAERPPSASRITRALSKYRDTQP